MRRKEEETRLNILLFICNNKPLQIRSLYQYLDEKLDIQYPSRIKTHISTLVSAGLLKRIKIIPNKGEKSRDSVLLIEPDYQTFERVSDYFIQNNRLEDFLKTKYFENSLTLFLNRWVYKIVNSLFENLNAEEKHLHYDQHILLIKKLISSSPTLFKFLMSDKKIESLIKIDPTNKRSYKLAKNYPKTQKEILRLQKEHLKKLRKNKEYKAEDIRKIEEEYKESLKIRRRYNYSAKDMLKIEKKRSLIIDTVLGHLLLISYGDIFNNKQVIKELKKYKLKLGFLVNDKNLSQNINIIRLLHDEISSKEAKQFT